MNAPQPGYKRCPDCAEDVREEARRCRFCGYSFERRPARSAFEFLRVPKPLSSEELLSSWGFELDPDEQLERMSYCRLDGVDGFLVLTARRVCFFTAKTPRCLLELERAAVTGSASSTRFGRSRIELSAGARTVVLDGFAKRAELVLVAERLGLELP